MCITYLALSCKLATRFEFFNVKTKNDCGGHVIFQDIEHQLREKILDNFLHYNVL